MVKAKKKEAVYEINFVWQTATLILLLLVAQFWSSSIFLTNS
jgi:hypothetical protein